MKPGTAGAGKKPGHAFVRPARLSFLCDYGTVEVIFDTQRFPALESIASDSNTARRVALINLWLNAQMEPARRDGIESLRVADLVLCDENSQADTRELEAGLPLIFDRAIPPLHCVLTSVPAGLVDELKARTEAVTPTSTDFHPAFLDLRMSGRLRFAERTCSTGTLNALRPRDVLLGWNTAYPSADGGPMAALMSWGTPAGSRLAASVEIQGSRVTLVTEPTMTQHAFDSAAFDSAAFDSTATLQDEPAEDGAQPDIGSLDELDVPVHLEISTLDLPLRTLATLQPGYLLELPIALEDAQVRLVVHGRTIGTGRLVAIGEHLGLQVSRIGSA
ncbi:type III secretion system cytoplasmic ring protein SctQ [Paraburkholderia xenovorans]|uniref:type III secretion system cytoplasmic ring protein SctQ n=1 Tax=Paraburkholderia xenovorans TaxID=36873 RepID=UPI0038B7BACA